MSSDKANVRSETSRMVDQLKGVTSIIGWVPFNEGWGQWSVQAAADVADVADQVKRQDPTRLVDARSGSNCSTPPGITDVEGEQNGFFTYDRQVEKVDEARVRASNLSVIAAGSEPAPLAPAGTPGLDGVGHWTLDEGQGTTAADTGRALHLTGGQFADTEETVVPTRGTNFSVSAWARLDSADGAFQTVVSEDGDTNTAFFLQHSGADQRWAVSFVGARALAADLGKPTVGQWYHLVGVRDTTASTPTIYVDGEAAGTTRVLDFLDGSVDDVKVFDRALSADQVAALHEDGAR